MVKCGKKQDQTPKFPVFDSRMKIHYTQRTKIEANIEYEQRHND